MRSSSFLPTLLVAVAATSSLTFTSRGGAQPRQVEREDPQHPQVEREQLDPAQRGAVHVEDVVRSPPAPTDPPPRVVVHGGYWGAGYDVAELTWQYQSPSVEALDGRQVPVEAFPRRGRQFGIFYGAGYKPRPWLRLPEVRVAFGGGGYRGPARAVGDQGLSVASSRAFLFRLELLAGVERELGAFTPFVRGYAAASLRTLRTRVSHADLGVLGAQRITKLTGDLGVEVGVTIHAREPPQRGDPRVGLMLAYRRGLLGVDAHGAILALSLTSR